jgi:hypothetical protein
MFKIQESNVEAKFLNILIKCLLNPFKDYDCQVWTSFIASNNHTLFRSNNKILNLKPKPLKIVIKEL